MTIYDVFIAHASPDKALARSLHEELKKQGLEPFLDAINILPGDDWDLEIPKALKNSKVIVVLIGDTYNKAYYLRDEVIAAIAYSRQDASAYRVVPIYLKGFLPADQIPYGLRPKQGLDWLSEGGAVGVAVNLKRLFATPMPVLGSPPVAPVVVAELARESRYEVLIRLSGPQFAELLFKINAPLAELPPENNAPIMRAIAVVQWLELQSSETRGRFDGLLRKMAPGLL